MESACLEGVERASWKCRTSRPESRQRQHASNGSQLRHQQGPPYSEYDIFQLQSDRDYAYSRQRKQELQLDLIPSDPLLSHAVHKLHRDQRHGPPAPRRHHRILSSTRLQIALQCNLRLDDLLPTKRQPSIDNDGPDNEHTKIDLSSHREPSPDSLAAQ